MKRWDNLMNDLSWKIEHLLTDMIDEVDKKYGGEVEIYIMDFYYDEFDDYDNFRAEELKRIYIEHREQVVSLEKFGDTYELDGLVPVQYIGIFSSALGVISEYLNKIEEALRGE